MFLLQNIRYLRKRENLSQLEFANLFGLNRSNIGSYEEGRAVPPLDVIIKMAKYFGITLSKLVEEDISVPDDKTLPQDNEEKDKLLNYDHTEIAILAIRNDVFTRALLQTTFEAISSWAELIKPEMKDLLLQALPKMLAEKYKELLINDRNISNTLAERLIHELEESLKYEG